MRQRFSGLILLATLGVAGCHPARGGHALAGSLEVTHAVIPASASPTEASAFMVLTNHGSTAVTFEGATSPVAASIAVHKDVGGLMQPAGPLQVPPGGYVLLAPGSYHLMLEGLVHPLAIGDTATVTLEFDQGGPLSVRVPVLNYTDAVSELPLR